MFLNPQFKCTARFEISLLYFPAGEFILELLCPYTVELSEIQENFEFISNDKAKYVEIKSDK